MAGVKYNPNPPNAVTDKFLTFAVWFAVTGDAEQAIIKAEYESNRNQTQLIESYRQFNLPEPPDAALSAELYDLISGRLTKPELADLIVASVRSGQDNKPANMVLEYFLSREQRERQDQYRSAEVDQKIRWALDDSETVQSLVVALGLHSALETVQSPSYWRSLVDSGQAKSVERVRALIDAALGDSPIRAYVDNGELSPETGGNVQTEPTGGKMVERKRRGRPPKRRQTG